MTGTSVIGIKYDGGVLLAADTLASYGSLARFDDITRLHQAGPHTCVAASGDMSDFQQLQHLIDAKLQVVPIVYSRRASADVLVCAFQTR